MNLNDFPVHMQNLALESVVQKAVNDNSLDGVSVTVDIDKNMIVMADAGLLQRIVVNILENSYKYRDKETAVLHIDARQKEDRIHLIFADNGPGLFLMSHPDQIFDREDLYEHVWGLESMGDNITVAVHINRLREKIEEDPQNPKYLQTVWGVGYRFFPNV